MDKDANNYLICFKKSLNYSIIYLSYALCHSDRMLVDKAKENDRGEGKETSTYNFIIDIESAGDGSQMSGWTKATYGGGALRIDID